MFGIFDGDGHAIGYIELSEKQQRLLEEDGASIVAIFHTPRMLQHVLGTDSGSFELSRKDDRLQVHASNLPALRRYIAMQIQIKEMQENALMPMQKAPIPFGEWRPDVALLDNKFASEVDERVRQCQLLQAVSGAAWASPPMLCRPRRSA